MTPSACQGVRSKKRGARHATPPGRHDTRLTAWRPRREKAALIETVHLHGLPLLDAEEDRPEDEGAGREAEGDGGRGLTAIDRHGRPWIEAAGAAGGAGHADIHHQRCP